LPQAIPALISESLRACDPELRQVLLGNVVLTGGGSLLSGFSERLAAELTRTFPHVRIFICVSDYRVVSLTIAQTKIHAPGNPIERRYGGWLGGSILASLGTFHQLWISREEWDVSGCRVITFRHLNFDFSGTWEVYCWSEV
jgi:actin-like protein 6A